MSQRGAERTSGRLRQTPASGDTSLRNPARGCLKPGVEWTAHEAESADVAHFSPHFTAASAFTRNDRLSAATVAVHGAGAPR
jgi:hypothetical protein